GGDVEIDPADDRRIRDARLPGVGRGKVDFAVHCARTGCGELPYTGNADVTSPDPGCSEVVYAELCTAAATLIHHDVILDVHPDQRAGMARAGQRQHPESETTNFLDGAEDARPRLSEPDVLAHSLVAPVIRVS